MIRLDEVSKLYPAKADTNDSGALLRALDAVSLYVEAGEWVAIMGPSGSGKSTLVNLIGCLDRPTSGSVSIDGEPVATLTDAQLNRVRAEKIGFVFQQFHLVPYLTTLENVMLAQYFHSMTDEREAREALEKVGLGERANHLPTQLSGGEQQRACIARALINDPKIILADEPTGNLDAHNQEIVLALLHELHRQGRTIVMVTHDPDMARLADRTIRLHHGQIADERRGAHDDREQFDDLLEEIWIVGEEGETAELGRLQGRGALPAAVAIERMASLGLVTMATHPLRRVSHQPPNDPCHQALRHSSETPAHGEKVVTLTAKGQGLAEGIIRRHRLAECLLTESFGLSDPNDVEAEACSFEHILSAEATERICTFLDHPAHCPHGRAIPPGSCCNQVRREADALRWIKR